MIKISKPFSPFLPIQASLWPLCVSLSIFAFFFSLESWIITGGSSFYLLSLSLAILGFISFLWFKDLRRERMLGYHTHKIEISLRVSMLLFILSEIFFFFSFFWAFFDSSLSPVIEIGIQWPPLGISPLPIFSVPLLNTIILLSRGATVTLAHHSLMNNYYKKSLIRLLLTVILGIYFLSIQWLEYDEAPFSISDRVYGSTFFMATGFHGFHVLAGTSYLFLVLIRIYHLKLTFNRHFIFESAAWYWHFVDVVWLFLFVSIYWWGSL